MNFDKITTAPCARNIPCGDNNPTAGVDSECTDPDYRATHLGECSDDPRCSDPLFAAANPSLCLNSPRLLLKPSTAVVEVLEEAQYRAFLWVNGQETELLTGVTYTVNNLSIALIGGLSGNAIGLSPGSVSVTATYGALQASADLKVIAVGACEELPQHFLLLFDISKSSTGLFGSGYATRLHAAESFAVAFTESLNLDRDNAAVMEFNTVATAVEPFTDDLAELTAAITSRASGSLHTNIGASLITARDYFATQGVTENKVIILFTDAENNEGDDPLPIAEAIKESGVVLIVVGLRAKGNAFRLAERMASDGFFINALPSNVLLVPTWLNGTKSYLCSGFCSPPGDITIGVGWLNYASFTNWDVTTNEVDLIGGNEGGTPLYNLLPGNGLYVDDHGSGGGFHGEMQSKEDFSFTPGNTYKLSLYIAGNQRQDSSRSTRVRVGAIIDNTVVRTWMQDFTLVEWSFTVVSPTSGKIIINGLENVDAERSYGNLIGRVILANTTTATTLLDDDFDNENLTYIPPCGVTGYSYYDYYDEECGDCLIDGPIPGQSGDPSPLPNLENEKAATRYRGFAEATATCPDDLDTFVTKVAEAYSDISQAEADLLAYQAALALAEEELVCP